MVINLHQNQSVFHNEKLRGLNVIGLFLIFISFLRFYSNWEVTASGFKIKYESIPSPCGADQFLCPGEVTRCIPKSWACDGVADCNGAEDEHNDTCGNHFQICLRIRHKFNILLSLGNWNCLTSELRCSSGTPVCISSRSVCDGIDDCKDKKDEDPQLCGEFFNSMV